MSTLPDRDQDLLQFAVDHSQAWAQAASAVGLTPAQAADFAGFLAEARGAFDDARAA